MTGRREHTRLHVISYVKVREDDTDRSVGRVVDMTARGMRLRSKEPVQTDTTARFRLILPAGSGEAREIMFEAAVIWCRKTPENESWDTGIQLLDVPPEDSELIERFVEESSYEDRWLALARCFSRDN